MNKDVVCIFDGCCVVIGIMVVVSGDYKVVICGCCDFWIIVICVVLVVGVVGCIYFVDGEFSCDCLFICIINLCLDVFFWRYKGWVIVFVMVVISGDDIVFIG